MHFILSSLEREFTSTLLIFECKYAPIEYYKTHQLVPDQFHKYLSSKKTKEFSVNLSQIHVEKPLYRSNDKLLSSRRENLVLLCNNSQG